MLELFALLSDPSLQLDPDGALANVLRLTLKNVHILPPRWACQLFPQAGAVLAKPGEFTLNVGTAVSGLQSLLTVGTHILDAVTEAGVSFTRAIKRLPEQVVPDVDSILKILPPELRKIRLGGALGGFEASVVILLVSPSAGVEALNQRDNPSPATPPARYVWGESTRVRSASSVPVPLGRRGQRESHPHDPSENLFLGLEFAEFSAEDIEDIVGADATAIVMAARIKVFEAQRYRFLGIASADGSFLLVTTADVRPLQLRIAGMTVGIPFEAATRMRLEGRIRRDGFSGGIEAQGYALWRPFSGLLLSIGTKKAPALLRLHSNRTFRFRGKVEMQLFAAWVDGSVDISNTHCFVKGRLLYKAGTISIGQSSRDLISLDLETEGRIGPGSAFRFAGSGSLRILDQTFTDVSALVTNRYAEVSASIDSEAVTALTGSFPLDLEAELSGTIDLRKDSNPSFSLKGRMKAKVFDFSIEGAGHISSYAGMGVRVGVEGTLFWGGHPWLGGFLEVGTNGSLLVGGRTRFAMPLTLQRIGNATFANLFCEVNVGGRFNMDPDKSLAWWEADASCTLGLKLPSPSNQVIPLASFRASQLPTAVPLRLKILSVKGFQVPGIPDIDVFVPVLEHSSIEVDVVTVGVDNVLEIYVPYISGSPGPEPKNWLGYIDREDFLTIPMITIKEPRRVKLGQLIADPINIYLTFEAGILQLEVVFGPENDLDRIFVPLV